MTAVADPVREFLADLAAKAPFVGRRVQVTKGAREGVRGVVRWHGADKFNPPTPTSPTNGRATKSR